LVGGFTGLVDAGVYFLSDTVPGSATLVAPTAGTSINKPMYIAVGSTSAVIVNHRGIQNAPSGSTGSTSRNVGISLIFGR